MNHHQSSDITASEAAELAGIKKKHHFLTPLNLLYPNPLSILTTNKLILEIEQLKSRTLSKKSVIEWRWRRIKPSNLGVLILHYIIYNVVSKIQQTSKYEDSPIYKMEDYLGTCLNLEVMKMKKRKPEVYYFEPLIFYFYYELLLFKNQLWKILNWIVVVDVDYMNVGMIIECKKFSSIYNKLQCEACSNGDLSFGVGRIIGEDEVRKIVFAMSNLRMIKFWFFASPYVYIGYRFGSNGGLELVLWGLELVKMVWN